jgi:hypothetical protein
VSPPWFVNGQLPAGCRNVLTGTAAHHHGEVRLTELIDNFVRPG